MSTNLTFGTVVFNISMNRFFKLKTIKKIVKVKLLKDYNLYLVFITDGFWNRNDIMKVEMFLGEELREYLLGIRKVNVRVNFENGQSILF
jgi:hypothetical protein